MTHRRVLIVAPAFHGYGRSVATAFERRGYHALLHDYDRNASITDKIQHKLVYELPDLISRRRWGARRHARQITRTAVQAVRLTRPDVVVTVRGDAFGEQYWDSLDTAGVVQVLWLYDEIARMSFRPEILSSRPLIVTYSHHDVRALTERGLTASHLRNAYDHAIDFVPYPRNEIVFVGARYPERARILSTLVRSGVPVRAYGRDWSGHPFDRLRTWRVETPDIPNGRDVPRAVAYGITAGAAAAVNTHLDQDGFTMRTYEIPGTGGLQLIDRADVAEVYEPDSEVLVFNSDEELVELARRAVKDSAWSTAIRDRGRQRTLAEHTFDHRIAELERLWV